ncbi:putative adhesin [Endozoicomonas euniceicola]|uniref:Putative adhesin Stv domain-containing protein n=1 Tax=Endozoicomonas euniceicola TaxID=1234143 RepID=A0ABY6GYS0_9GAMM|nr:hypothetical protein [Endozoicomonas euniceicola]UYM17143.1 hypothetical protein NX720_04260 [Endozoicomonas euniceicola]
MPFFKPKVKTSTPSEALRLFTCNRLAGRKVENLILYCHGGYELSLLDLTNASREKKFAVPSWLSIYFYAPHGSEIFSSIYKFMRGYYEPYKIYTGCEECFDYTLARTEEYSESKSYIKQVLLDYRSSLDKTDIKRLSRLFDIACPTDNWFIRLSEVLDIMKFHKKLSRYRKVHCLFCRGVVYPLREEAQLNIPSLRQRRESTTTVAPRLRGSDNGINLSATSLNSLHYYDPTSQLPPNIYKGDLGRWLITDIDVED